MALAAVAGSLLASCGKDGTSQIIVESPPWVCSGTVSDRDHRALSDVEIWTNGYRQSASDSTGAYLVVLGPDPAADEAVLFRHSDYEELLARLADATIVGDHRLILDVVLPGGKDEH
jgi:hypothetical protein